MGVITYTVGKQAELARLRRVEVEAARVIPGIEAYHAHLYSFMVSNTFFANLRKWHHDKSH